MKCSKPTITNLEKYYVNQALDAGDIGIGDFIEKFESKWALYNFKGYGVSCNSGTNAIYLALKALGIGPGDEVIVPEFTMIATAWAVTYTGATPVFVDCKDDLTIDPELIKKAIHSNTKAIIPVHIYGRTCDRVAIQKIAKKHKLFIVEDMAEGHGIQPTGDISCYSFYGNKILTTGEGGMCLTNNKKLADEMRLYANMYFDKKRTLIHPKIGHNFRMTNLQAAVGLAQVERCSDILEKRRQIEVWYDTHLPKSLKMPSREVLWVYDIDCGDGQEKIKEKLAQNDIESRYGFKCMSQQPMYLGEYKHLNAYKWSKRILYLPTFYDLTEEQIKEICQILPNNLQ